jgi:hypothetical protein
MLVFGGYNYDGWWNYLDDVWALSLSDVPQWSRLAPTGTSPGGVTTPTATYDPVRDRMIVFGGWNGIGGGNSAVALPMSNTPGWTRLSPQGSWPAPRYWHSAVYDPLRDRMILYGGMGNTSMLDDVWALAWDDPSLARVTCPGADVWAPGGSMALRYGIFNPYAFVQTADYRLTSGRAWSGFPITGSVLLGANATAVVPLSVPVPDSVAIGGASLTFQATLRSLPQYASCTHELTDVPVPVMLSLVSADADPDRVRLTWYAAGGGLVATVYRRTAEQAWSAVGQAAPDGSGQLVYEDRAVAAGTRYGYRLGALDQGREVFVGETWVEVPLAPRLALAGLRPNPAAADLAVAFSLPDAAPARLELFDLAGRRVLAWDVGALGGGSHVLPLAEGQALASGVYLLRLTRGGRALTSRAVIVR